MRDAEIPDEGVIEAVEEQVLGLQVPVNDTGRVNCRQSASDIAREAERPPRITSEHRDVVLERAEWSHLCDKKEVRISTRFSSVENLQDEGVLDAPEDLDLSQESCLSLVRELLVAPGPLESPAEVSLLMPDKDDAALAAATERFVQKAPLPDAIDRCLGVRLVGSGGCRGGRGRLLGNGPEGGSHGVQLVTCHRPRVRSERLPLRKPLRMHRELAERLHVQRVGYGRLQHAFRKVDVE